LLELFSIIEIVLIAPAGRVACVNLLGRWSNPRHATVVWSRDLSREITDCGSAGGRTDRRTDRW